MDCVATNDYGAFVPRSRLRDVKKLQNWCDRHARLTVAQEKDELDAKVWETNAFARGRVILIPVGVKSCESV